MKPTVPAGTKFLAAYRYKKYGHVYYSKGNKMNSPVVVYIDGEEWKTFQSFTKAQREAIAYIKSMMEKE
jgi:hypothetical protein